MHWIILRYNRDLIRYFSYFSIKVPFSDLVCPTNPCLNLFSKRHESLCSSCFMQFSSYHHQIFKWCDEIMKRQNMFFVWQITNIVSEVWHWYFTQWQCKGLSLTLCYSWMRKIMNGENLSLYWLVSFDPC